MPGEEQPASITDRALPRRKQELTPEALAAGVIGRDRMIIGKALSLMESTAPRHQEAKRELLRLLTPHAGNAFRLGISGVPGVGKSTFIEALGVHAIERGGARVAVLAIDPSSELTGGSILGDKTRMTRLASHPDALVRPSASGSWLGGVARASRESILVCEAAGYDLVIVETVGVGQSETQAASMVDYFLLLMLAGAGDELQGIKRGILETADGVAINKADGDNLGPAKIARSQLQGALRLLRANHAMPVAEVLLCSALNGTGIPELWAVLSAWRDRSIATGERDAKRRRQSLFWMNQSIEHMLRQHFEASEAMQAARSETERLVLEGTLSPFDAALQLIELAFENPNKPSDSTGKDA
ncbi:methylmalonyl Co-A mutase-associated GTPase MeaB [bacterium]|nr:methylmalonyl Co-A mutase-associated GTPase MeaB [bacterium]